MIQDFIVYLLVAAAVFYLARMLWSSTQGKSGCNSCGANKCAKPQKSDDLIQIGIAPRDGK